MSQTEMETQIISKLMMTALASGEVATDGLSDEEVKRACLEYLHELTESDDEWVFIIDHRESILEEAHNFKKQEKYEMSLVFYAMWLEHWINNIYQVISQRKGLSAKDYKDMIKSLNMRAKTGWFMKLLDLPELDSEMLKIFNKVIESRNSFVHYKWQSVENESKNELTKQELLSQIELLIEYLNRYEVDNVFFGYDLTRA